MHLNCIIQNSKYYFWIGQLESISGFGYTFRIVRSVKMGWNLRANLVQYRFRPGWVEIFLQILIRVDF